MTVNHSNHATHELIPKMIPGGRALVAAWNSPDHARDAFRGPLRSVLSDPRRFSLDGEIVRVRLQEDHHNWHGWIPSDEGAGSISKKDPLVVVVHGVLKPRHLARFVRNNVHAASRAAHHPGHRGSVDISSSLPFEHTSVSLWESLGAAIDYAYPPGGHATAMKYAQQQDTHRTGVFLRIKPVASTGSLGLDEPAYPDLPAAVRG
ncbi:hypothetical protein ACNHUS_23040 [Actinomycetes bacterium M1A6_2h]